MIVGLADSDPEGETRPDTLPAAKPNPYQGGALPPRKPNPFAVAALAAAGIGLAYHLAVRA